MKTLIFSILFFSSPLFLLAGNDDKSDSTGLAGDNLDLYAVLELFKKADSPEKFEELLNKEDSQVNNLDLNGDDEIDYIKVIDRLDSNVHAITLQVPISETESQDIAVITIEKIDDATAYLQIIGDEDLYGKDYIIEPFDDKGDKEFFASPIAVVVNVWGWPCVRFIHTPAYRPWVSPWRWHHYPTWWKPWKPVWWHVYHPRVVHHHHHYHRATIIRTPRAHTVYHNHRVHTANIHHHRSTPNRNNNNAHRTNTKVNKTNKEVKKNNKVKMDKKGKNNVGKKGKR